uniref:VWFA domain-containing protein n=1 Tax=Ditylum brightwellii TaxID=49249 RepID=A0A7S1ZBR6_9STRA|mmetsp:Transcript_28691/g.42602  ORF Transcript_28691/g.42602 Transcript_28691/m.42602 type:complete len:443 (+) Transcript_28691:163-1491(+)
MTAPKKYIKVNGVMKLNPAYKRWREAQGGQPASTTNNQALPIISSMQDYEALNDSMASYGEPEVALAESTNATIEIMQEPDISIEAGMSPDTMVDELGDILIKYEVPIGLMNKLMGLNEFHVLEFLIDDSGSMNIGRPISRWQEAQSRLKEMIEVLAYVPFNQVEIIFLNRSDRVSLQRQGRHPKSFMDDAYRQIDAAFVRPPSGTTPVLEKLQNSILSNQHINIARWFFGDGLPNGGVEAQKEITNLLAHRPNPAMSPMTFISCTEINSDVEWMKECEEIAPYCSESDDFVEEANEVLRDQGAALPYSYGFHLVCTLVAAINPEDLDAMDESVPFTKVTLDNLLGIKHDEQSYLHYFTCFEEAQRKRRVVTELDQLKKETKWNYEEFLKATKASQIPTVRYYKDEMKYRGNGPAKKNKSRAVRDKKKSLNLSKIIKNRWKK